MCFTFAFKPFLFSMRPILSGHILVVFHITVIYLIIAFVLVTTLIVVGTHGTGC